MSDIDVASLEAKISSLDATSLLVLSKIAEGKNNEEITAWSGPWKFSPSLINQSLDKIFSLFDLDHLSDFSEKRSRAGQLYGLFVQAKFQPRQ